MKWYRWISGLTFSLLGLICSGNALAIDYDVSLTLGQTHTFNHLVTDTNDYSGLFTDTGTFELADAGSVSVSFSDNELTSTFIDLLNVSEFTVLDGASNALFSTGIGGDLVNATFTLSGLAAGLYTLQFVGNANGAIGAAYDVTVSSVPLPAAAWLFGTALIGFVTFSARRSV
jgi:hypothetical protein